MIIKVEKPIPVPRLYAVVVRAGKDRDAVKAALTRFYNGWGIEAYSAGGIRNPEAILDEVLRISRDYRFTLYIAGREDSEVVRLIEALGEPRVTAVSIDKMRVRNARLEQIFWAIEKARAKLRLLLGWNLREKVYTVHYLKRDSVKLNGFVYDEPYCDVFLAFKGWLRMIGVKHYDESEDYLVIERLSGGEHRVFSQEVMCGLVKMPDDGKPYVSVNCEPVHGLSALIHYNIHVLQNYEDVSRGLLEYAVKVAEEELGKVDAIVVPWSGGKDSTLALHLAKKFLRDVIAVYVDTGVDFPHTRQFVKEASEKMRVELVEVYAPVREHLAKLGLPSHTNRWCTGLKLDALCKALRRVGEKLVIITGDRDAESETRSRRAPLRLEVRECGGEIKTIVVSPLKQWSTLLVQLYILANNVPLNPLYEQGFYRLGCYICPALRSWELNIMRSNPHVASYLLAAPYYWRILRTRHLNPSVKAELLTTQ